METSAKRRDIIKNITIVFLIVMLLLTFFSTTIMNLSLPEVAAQYAWSGQITTSVRASGMTEANENYQVIIEEGRVIQSLNVRRGDDVQKDDILFLLEDEESTELQAALDALKEAKKSYTKWQMDRGNAVEDKEEELRYAREDLQKIKSKGVSGNAAEGYEAVLKSLRKQLAVYQLAEAQLAYDAAKAEYDAAKADYDTAEAAYEAAEAAVDAANDKKDVTTDRQSDLQDAVNDANDALSEAQRALSEAEGALSEAEGEEKSAENALEAAKQELKTLEDTALSHDALTSQERDLERKRIALSRAEAELAADKKTYEDALAAADELERKMLSAKSAYDSAVAGSDSSSLIAGWQNSIANLNKQLSPLKTQLSEKQSALSALDAGNQTLLDQKAEFEEKVETLRLKIAVLDDKLAAEQAKETPDEAVIADVNAQKTPLAEERASYVNVYLPDIEQKLTAYAAENHDKRVTLVQEIGSLETQVSALEDEILKYQTWISSEQGAHYDTSSYAEAYQEAQSAYNANKSTISGLEASIPAKEESIADQKLEYSYAEEDYLLLKARTETPEQRQKAISDAKADVSEKEQALSDAQTAVSEKQTAVTAAENVVKEKKQALSAAEAAVKSVGGEIKGDSSVIRTANKALEAANKVLSEKQSVRNTAENALNTAENALDAAKQNARSDGKTYTEEELEKLIEETEISIEKTQESLEYAQQHGGEGYPTEEAYKEALTAQERSIDSMETDLERYNEQCALDEPGYTEAIERAQKEVDRLSETVGDSAIRAKVGGRIGSVYVSAGQKVDAQTTLCEIEQRDKGYSVTLSMTAEEAKRVAVGQQASILYYWGNTPEAVVESVKPSQSDPQNTRVVTLRLSGDVTAGQNFTFSLGEKSSNYDTVVPKSALRQDSSGQFVLVVTAKNTPVGNRYTATRMDVDVIAQDETSAAVSGLSGGEFVICTSATPVSPGQQVRLAENG